MRPPVQLKPAGRPPRLFPDGYRRPINFKDLQVLIVVVVGGMVLIGVLVAGGVFIATHPDGFIPSTKPPARPLVIETDARPR